MEKLKRIIHAKIIQSALITSIGLLLITMNSVQAANFVVTNATGETFGNGDCNANGTGTGCSLGQGINAANANGSSGGTDTITFKDTRFQGTRTIDLDFGLYVNSSTRIVGTGAKNLTITCARGDTIFKVDKGKYFGLSGATLICTRVNPSGDGIYSNGYAYVTDCLFKGFVNGINSAGDGTTNIYNSAFVDNRIGCLNDSRLNANNCTFISSYSLASGITNYATINLANCTIVNNFVGLRNQKAATIKNTIIAGNQFDTDGGGSRYGGFNLIKVTPEAAGLEVNSSGKAVLADNGGAIPTVAIITSSGAAVNAGRNSFAVDNAGIALETDQRGAGFPRKSDGRTDIGAYESSFASNRAPAVTTTSLPDGQNGSAYLFALSASDPDADELFWTLSAGSLPAGITLSSDGTLSGTPLTSGTSTFMVAVSDARGGLNSRQLSLTVKSSPTLNVVLSNTAPKTNDVVTALVTPTNFDTAPTYTYEWFVDNVSKQSGDSNSLNLAIPGFGDKSQTISVTVTATAGSQSAASTASTTVVNSTPVASNTTLSGTVGQPFSKQLIATDVDGDPLSYFLADTNPLPAGLTLNPTGLITGTPTTAGTFTRIFKAYSTTDDLVSNSATVTFSITASANVAPTNVSVSPPSSSSSVGVTRVFTVTYSDANGNADISQVRLLINATTSTAAALYVHFDAAQNKLYLYSDTGTTLSSGVTPGTATILSNSQGSLNCGASSVTRSGNQLVLKLSITPSSSFVGTKNLYAWVKDKANATSGFGDLGDWMITSVNSPPTITVTSPNNGSILSYNDFVTAFSGTASDDVEVSSASVLIFRNRVGKNEYFNGSEFTTAQVYLPLQLTSPGSLTTAWKWTSNLPPASRLDVGTYTAFFRAIDSNGRISDIVRRDINVKDTANQAPTISIAAPANAARVLRDNFAAAFTGNATDDVNIASAKIMLFRSRNGLIQFWNGTAFVPGTQTYLPLQLTTPNAISTSWSWTQSLPAPALLDVGSYVIFVYSVDGTGKSSPIQRRDFSVINSSSTTSSSPEDISETPNLSASRS